MAVSYKKLLDVYKRQVFQCRNMDSTISDYVIDRV